MVYLRHSEDQSPLMVNNATFISCMSHLCFFLFHQLYVDCLGSCVNPRFTVLRQGDVYVVMLIALALLPCDSCGLLFLH